MSNIVYTGGTFDLFHEGHIELLRSCHRIAAGGEVIVGLNTDEFIAAFKNNPPIQSYRERALMLESCRYVDKVVPNIGNGSSTVTIQDQIDNGSAIDVVAIGSDWAGRDYYGQMGFTKKWLDDRDIILIYIDRRTGMSTTKIKDKLKNA